MNRVIFKKILSFVRGKGVCSNVETNTSVFANEMGDGYVIENGILISYEVKSEVCLIPEGVTELKDFAINRN